MRCLPLLIALGACGAEAGSDVTGPFTGETHRFVVDGFALPRDNATAMALAADLDGDADPENQFGVITSLLASVSDLSIHASDMVAAGALASTVEIVADHLDDDDTVAVRYLGADDDPATLAGGRLVGGGFRSNRTAATRVPGRAVLRLPVFTNASPLALELDGMELDLEPDGRGGYDAVVRGGLRQQHAREVAYAGLLEMFATEPERHVVFARGVDANRDDILSTDELEASVIGFLVTADLQLFDGARYAPRARDATPDSVSLAIGLHLTPCPAGRCTTTPPVERCRDRVRDGDETDVDCGGWCQPCAAALACAVPADCQSAACDGGACRAPACDDLVRDGFESDVDCGGACGPCLTGRRCADTADCAAGRCSGGVCVAAVD